MQTTSDAIAPMASGTDGNGIAGKDPESIRLQKLVDKLIHSLAFKHDPTDPVDQQERAELQRQLR